MDRKLNIKTGRSFPTINASSTSGPATIYMQTSQTEGYGLKWTGGLLTFNTETTLIFSNFGVGSGDLYLQNFSAEFNPGEIPTASYSFMFFINQNNVTVT